MSRASLGDNIHGHEILLPVRLGYILLTLVLALLVDLVPMPQWLSWVWPDLVALVLVYWGVFQPYRLGLLPAWGMGLLMDVADGALFGQHALAYAALMYGAIFLHRRIQMFPLGFQVAHVAALLLAERCLQLLVRLVAGEEFPGIGFFGGSLTAAALWPVLVVVVKMPLRPRGSGDA
jgi:rod shape-determining protein MreD